MTVELPTISASDELQRELLAWAAENLRELPWRSTRDPWSVLVSEIMLQQTQVARVIERHQEFMQLFPDPAACAAAPVAEVIRLWDGLGFNRRAVNLWKTAVAITELHGGVLPHDLTTLMSLPGIGPYTGRAVLAFAFEQDVGVLDTNVGRLLARWTGHELAPKHAQQLADALVPTGQGWLWNQALFDFANAQCVKRSPDCERCPLRRMCVWQGVGADPATRSAGVSSPQSTFEGSRRQVRGRLVSAMRDRSVPAGELRTFATDNYPLDVVRTIVEELVAEGLVQTCDGEFRLSQATSSAAASGTPGKV